MPRVFINLSGVPTPVTGSAAHFSQATFFAISGFNNSGVAVPNKGSIYVGINSGELCMTASPGSSFGIPYYFREQRDSLGAYWINGTSGDSCYIIYSN